MKKWKVRFNTPLSRRVIRIVIATNIEDGGSRLTIKRWHGIKVMALFRRLFFLYSTNESQSFHAPTKPRTKTSPPYRSSPFQFSETPVLLRRNRLYRHRLRNCSHLVQDGWITLRFEWIPSEPSYDLVVEPYLQFLRDHMAFATSTLYPRLYFSYNVRTRQTTIMTTDLDESHLRMTWHLETLPETGNQAECAEQMVQLLIQYFAAVHGCFAATAVSWNDSALGGVCCGERQFTLRLMSLPFTQQEMASKTLDMSGDHNDRVRNTESTARAVDRARGDFVAFQCALLSLERRLQDIYLEHVKSP